MVEQLAPSIRDRREALVQRCAKLFDNLWKWARKIFVLADAKFEARHVDAAAEASAVRIQRHERCAFLGREDRAGKRIAVRIEIAIDAWPIEVRHSRFDWIVQSI